MAITYRLMTIDDYNEVYDIWVACHNGLNSTDDSKEGIEKYLKRNPTTSFVAVDDGHVAGVILCGHDGRRGYIQHMSISPDHRRLGIEMGLDCAVPPFDGQPETLHHMIDDAVHIHLVGLDLEIATGHL